MTFKLIIKFTNDVTMTSTECSAKIPSTLLENRSFSIGQEVSYQYRMYVVEQ